jgi:predicted O-linked N-acetylglucosamine transferase (SPINDLY family)
VRLGKDEVLRQQVALKLKASRQTAPLWNGKQFTREMEKAYEQMWQRYIEKK